MRRSCEAPELAMRPTGPYFNMLLVDGVCLIDEAGQSCSGRRRIPAQGICRHWSSASRSDVSEAGPLDDLIGHSITCSIAVGPKAGQVRHQPKAAYRDGTTHIVLEARDLMARLAALVPPPRMDLTRFHGAFAPHSKLRAAVTPASSRASPGSKSLR
jgi:hypothetical protein